MGSDREGREAGVSISEETDMTEAFKQGYMDKMEAFKQGYMDKMAELQKRSYPVPAWLKNVLNPSLRRAMAQSVVQSAKRLPKLTRKELNSGELTGRLFSGAREVAAPGTADVLSTQAMSPYSEMISEAGMWPTATEWPRWLGYDTKKLDAVTKEMRTIEALQTLKGESIPPALRTSLDSTLENDRNMYSELLSRLTRGRKTGGEGLPIGKRGPSGEKRILAIEEPGSGPVDASAVKKPAGPAPTTRETMPPKPAYEPGPVWIGTSDPSSPWAGTRFDPGAYNPRDFLADAFAVGTLGP